MKLPNRTFYELESTRQDYVGSFESIPYQGGIMAAIFFCGFAMRTPIASKLYKETFYSLLMGGACGCVYTLYARDLYHKKVSVVYYDMKA
jgi:hypothetical protein